MVSFNLTQTLSYSLDDDTQLKKDLLEYLFQDYLEEDSISDSLLNNIDKLQGTEPNIELFLSKIEEVISDYYNKNISELVEMYNLDNRLNILTNDDRVRAIEPTKLQYSIKKLENPSTFKKLTGYGSFTDFSASKDSDKLIETLALTEKEIDELEDDLVVDLTRALLKSLPKNKLEESTNTFKSKIKMTKKAIESNSKTVSLPKLTIKTDELGQLKNKILQKQGVFEITSAMPRRAGQNKAPVETSKSKIEISLTGSTKIEKSVLDLFSNKEEFKPTPDGILSFMESVELTSEKMAKVMLSVLPSILEVDLKNNVEIVMGFNSKKSKEKETEIGHDFMTSQVMEFKEAVEEFVAVTRGHKTTKKDSIELLNELETLHTKRINGLFNETDLKRAKEIFNSLYKLDTELRNIRRIGGQKKDDGSPVDKFIERGYKPAIQLTVEEIGGVNAITVFITHEFMPIKFTQESTIIDEGGQAPSGVGGGDTGKSRRTARPLAKKPKESVTDYQKRMESLGLGHLNLMGDVTDMNEQREFVENFFHEIMGNREDIIEVIDEIQDKVIS